MNTVASRRSTQLVSWRRWRGSSNFVLFFYSTVFFLYKNVVFSGQTEYSYFSADFSLKMFLRYSWIRIEKERIYHNVFCGLFNFFTVNYRYVFHAPFIELSLALLSDWDKYNVLRVTAQARIHTGFHRLMEIGQIFHNKYIFYNKKNFPSWNPVWLTRKPWKGDFKEQKSKKFPEGACPWTPLEACAFVACLGNWSVFILDPRLLHLLATESCVLDLFIVLLWSGLYLKHIAFQTKDGLD